MLINNVRINAFNKAPQFRANASEQARVSAELMDNIDGLFNSESGRKSFSGVFSDGTELSVHKTGNGYIFAEQKLDNGVLATSSINIIENRRENIYYVPPSIISGVRTISKDCPDGKVDKYSEEKAREIAEKLIKKMFNADSRFEPFKFSEFESRVNAFDREKFYSKLMRTVSAEHQVNPKIAEKNRQSDKIGPALPKTIDEIDDAVQMRERLLIRLKAKHQPKSPRPSDEHLYKMALNKQWAQQRAKEAAKKLSSPPKPQQEKTKAKVLIHPTAKNQVHRFDYNPESE